MTGEGFFGFFHSGAAHAPVFEAMLRELAADLPVRHAVREDLLTRARAEGVTEAVREAVAVEILRLAGEGAAVVLCTCSTLGPGAELAATRTDVPVLRIDRPMVEEALAAGSRILIAAALASTLGPTRDLVLRVGAERGLRPEIREVVAEGSWPLFEAGDRQGYWRRIAETVRAEVGDAEVVVLAQASMAGAAELLPDLGIPVLSSPEAGLRRALALAGRPLPDRPGEDAAGRHIRG
jgi:Asp/Glu/hydantoin racemase